MTKLKRSGEDPEIRAMRVRAWVQAVKQASGLSLAELEDEFSQRWAQRSPSLRSCIWEKYQRGEVVPRAGLRTKEGLSLVERVEERYPGTARWLSLPLWRLADKAPMDMKEIRAIYEGLPKLLRSIFIAGPDKASEIFWRRPVDHEHVCDIVLRIGDLDALVVALALVREAEITQNQDQHEVGVETVKKCLYLLQYDPVLGKKLVDELREYLGVRWENAKYFSIPEESDADDEALT